MALKQRISKLWLRSVTPGYLAVKRRQGDPMAALLTRQVAHDPYPRYRELRERGHVLPSFVGCVVFGHHEANEVFRSKVWGSDPRRLPGFGASSLEYFADSAFEDESEIGNSLLNLDPPEHTRLRAFVSRAFSPRAIDRLRTDAEKAVDELLAPALRRGTLEVVHELAYPLPLAVVSAMLGVPSADLDRVKQWGYDVAPAIDPLPSARQARRAAEADAAAARYFAGLIEARRSEPRDDLLSELIAGQEAGSSLSDGELLQTCTVILVAGFVTTVNLISSGVLLLLQHPEQLRALSDDPALIPNAVEEMLRFEPPIQSSRRYALEDTVIGGVPMPAGRTGVVSIGAANRDPEVFTDPDTFDIARSNAAQHLAFASGIHHCLGAALARLEGQIVFEALLRDGRMLELAGKPERRLLLNLRGLETLPVRFAAGRRY